KTNDIIYIKSFRPVIFGLHYVVNLFSNCCDTFLFTIFADPTISSQSLLPLLLPSSRLIKAYVLFIISISVFVISLVDYLLMLFTVCLTSFYHLFTTSLIASFHESHTVSTSPSSSTISSKLTSFTEPVAFM